MASARTARATLDRALHRSLAMPVAGPLRILIIEDEPLMSWSLAETLGEGGDIVTEVSTGCAAVRALVMADSIDVILLDYLLPDSCDLTLLSTIREIAPQSALVLLSAHLTPELAWQARQAGADLVLTKPIDLAALPGLVHGAARAHQPAPTRSATRGEGRPS